MRRRALLLTALMAAALVVASGMAFAATISCPNRDGKLCVGTPRGDTMTGRNSADDIRGRSGSDTLRAGKGSDKLRGDLGNDTLQGAGGNDTYLFDDGWGQDSISRDNSGVDTLEFSATSANLSVDLVPTSGTAEASSGTSTLNITNTELVIENVRGGTGRNNIKGNEANNRLFGNADHDALYGRGGNDTLSGGASTDDLYGAAGNDTMNGGEGNDAYHFEADNQGNDTIVDIITPNNDLFGNQLNFSNITEGLIVNLVSSDSRPEVTNTFGTSTIEWSGSVIDNVSSSNSSSFSNDTINGNPNPNFIRSFGGTDTISAGGGSDFINVRDGAGGDEVDCGGIPSINPDNDTVVRDSSDTASNCENDHIF